MYTRYTYIHTIASASEKEVVSVFLGQVVLLCPGEVEVVQRHRQALQVSVQKHAADHFGESRFSAALTYIQKLKVLKVLSTEILTYTMLLSL